MDASHILAITVVLAVTVVILAIVRPSVSLALLKVIESVLNRLLGVVQAAQQNAEKRNRNPFD